MKTSITSIFPGSTSYSSSRFRSSSSCPSSLCLLCFTKPFLPCPCPVPVPVFACPLCSRFPCIVVSVFVFLCSCVLIPRPCIALAISSRSFSRTRALYPHPTWSASLYRRTEGIPVISRPNSSYAPLWVSSVTNVGKCSYNALAENAS